MHKLKARLDTMSVEHVLEKGNKPYLNLYSIPSLIVSHKHVVISHKNVHIFALLQ